MTTRAGRAGFATWWARLALRGALATVLVVAALGAAAIWLTAAVDRVRTDGWSTDALLASSVGLGAILLALSGVIAVLRGYRATKAQGILLLLALCLVVAGLSG
jgi:hypothetical protein